MVRIFVQRNVSREFPAGEFTAPRYRQHPPGPRNIIASHVLRHFPDDRCVRDVINDQNIEPRCTFDRGDPGQRNQQIPEILQRSCPLDSRRLLTLRVHPEVRTLRHLPLGVHRGTHDHQYQEKKSLHIRVHVKRQGCVWRASSQRRANVLYFLHCEL